MCAIGSIIQNYLATDSDLTVNLTIHDQSDYNVHNLFLKGLQENYQIDPMRFSSNQILSNLLDRDAIQSPEMLHLFKESDIITCCFLLNEIISTSKAAFALLIQTLVSNMKKNSYLLVIDPASDFSEIDIGNNNQTSNSSQYLLFHLLDAIQAFEQVQSTNSTWYRFSPLLQAEFPIKLQNMRYFLRLYRKK